METQAMPKEHLIDGRAYKVHARNFNVAIWTGQTFAGLRDKAGYKFIDEELLHEEGGTCVPLELLG